jgi:hypothetical protein
MDKLTIPLYLLLFQYWITDNDQKIFAHNNFQSKNRPVTDLWYRK